MDSVVVNIRIEVDPNRDDDLEAWADREKRSKREHVLFIVETVLDVYRRDPLILDRLRIGMSGIPALASA